MLNAGAELGAALSPRSRAHDGIRSPMAEPHPKCAACGRAIEPGAGRYRRDDREFHGTCYGANPGQLAGIDVLLVAEDEVLDEFAMVLRAAGARVIPAADPREAIAVLTAVLPRVIVTMITFAGQRHDGRWLLEEVARRHPSSTIPVVGLATEESASDPAGDLSFDAVLTKPEGDQLVVVVRGVVEVRPRP